MKIKKLLTDIRHWIGWIISSLGVFGTLYLFKIKLPYYVIASVFIVLVAIDIIKHKLELQ